MGLYALELGQFERMMDYFAKAAEHAKQFDALPETVIFSSPLLNRLVFERNAVNGVGTCTAEYREWLSQKEKLLESGRYEEVLAMFE